MTVAPTLATDKAVSANATSLKRLDVSWVGVSVSETADAIAMSLRGPAAVQFTGTFNDATVVLKASNDGSNWVGIQDAEGVMISATSDAIFEFETFAAYIKPVVTGGSTPSVNVYVSMWSSK